MYEFKDSIMLVTNASCVNQNLALHKKGTIADTLACIHGIHINIIPILGLERRYRYVPISNAHDKRNGVINQIKWSKLNGEVVFLTVSTFGLQVYDADVFERKFFYISQHGCPMGVCVIEASIVCVGTSSGYVLVLNSNKSNTDCQLIEQFNAHEDPITFLDGYSKYLVTSSECATYLWVRDKQFSIVRDFAIEGLNSSPTVMKIASNLVLIGYESGELCVFDIRNVAYAKRIVAHKLKITGIDFCVTKQIAITASEDSYIKIWDTNDDSSNCKFFVVNECGPLCGVGFLNDNGTEFCVTTFNSTKVNIFSKRIEN